MRTGTPLGYISIFALVLALAPAAHTSGDVALTGFAKARSGAPLQGVTVTVESDALLGRTRTTTSDANGRFRFPALPTGLYTLRGELFGHEDHELELRLPAPEEVLLVLQADARQHLPEEPEDVPPFQTPFRWEAMVNIKRDFRAATGNERKLLAAAILRAQLEWKPRYPKRRPGDCSPLEDVVPCRLPVLEREIDRLMDERNRPYIEAVGWGRHLEFLQPLLEWSQYQKDGIVRVHLWRRALSFVESTSPPTREQDHRQEHPVRQLVIALASQASDYIPVDPHQAVRLITEALGLVENASSASPLRGPLQDIEARAVRLLANDSNGDWTVDDLAGRFERHLGEESRTIEFFPDGTCHIRSESDVRHECAKGPPQPLVAAFRVERDYVVVTPGLDQGRHRIAAPDVFRIVTWGPRVYLVPDHGLADFCSELRGGRLSRGRSWKRHFVRDDGSPPPTGSPMLAGQPACGYRPAPEGSKLVLRAELVSPPRVVLGEPVLLRLALENRGTHEVVLPFPPNDDNLSAKVIGPDARVLPHTGDISHPTGPMPVPLGPGESITAIYKINTDFVLEEPGAYTAVPIYATHRHSDAARIWEGTLEGNAIEFSIDPIPNGERAACEASLGLGFGHPGRFGIVRANIDKALRFLDGYPDSVYAPYVSFYAGETLQRSGWRDQAISHFQTVKESSAPKGLRSLAEEHLRELEIPRKLERESSSAQ